jgi:rhamnosyltransferase
MKNLSPLHSFQVSVIIPTLNAESQLPRIIERLRSQSLSAVEIYVIDSSSDDQTTEIAKRAGIRWDTIPRELFNHGRARNMAADLIKGNILVFLSQDALPKDDTFLEELTRPILKEEAVAVTARQIPYPDASPLEEYARQANYPKKSHIRTLSDVAEMGVMAYFFSNAASAVRKDAIEIIGGFPEDVVVNEDMKLCADLLHAGYAVAYSAEAQVYHSHDFDLGDQFSRYFDIGVFYDQAGDPIEAQSPIRRGRTFAFGQIRYLINQGMWHWIPASVLESVAKYAAFQLGKRRHLLPNWLKRRFSRQKYFWE